jgi:hypothetical protein
MRIDRVLQRLFLPLFCILLSLAGSAKRYEINLSDSSRISLLTCSSGNELYSIFGHSAIRVSDPMRNLDIVFNYGTFDFFDPNFYPNFVRGRLKYILSVSPYREFNQSYVEEGRWIWEQRLNINLNEKQHLFDSLLINYRPENRYYHYDFFGDNCATRIRDIFVKTIPRKITFDYSSFEKGKSFRQLLMPNLTNSPWAKLGINLLLGLPADRVASPWEYMYLPEHLQAAFQHSSLLSDSIKLPFVQQTKVLLEGKQLSDQNMWGTPLQVFLVILLIAAFLSYRDFKKSVKNLWFDRILLVIFGLMGVLFTFLWAGTAHRSMVWNFNLLWANPFHLIVVFFLSIKKTRRWVQSYLIVSLIILITLLFAWPFLPQALPWVIYPVILAMAMRLFIIIQLPHWLEKIICRR